MKKKILFIFCFTLASIGFSQTKSLEELSATPNPFTTQTNISFSAKQNSIITLTIKNILGKVVYKKEHKTKIGKNNILFSKNNLPKGIYIYSIRDTKKMISKRFIIK